MKKILMTLLSAMALLPCLAGNNVAPWGWATCADESGTAYTLSGGNFTDAKTVTLKALGGGQSEVRNGGQGFRRQERTFPEGIGADFAEEKIDGGSI